MSVLSGFLGAGKTTLLNRLVAEAVTQLFDYFQAPHPHEAARPT